MIASDLITLALKIAGVTSATEPAQAQDLSDGLLLLNAMLSQWQRRRFLIWRLADLAEVSTGALSYLVGPDAPSLGFNITPRPARIEAAYIRRYGPGSTDFSPVDFTTEFAFGAPQTFDFPLGIIRSREDYARISMKTLTTWPAAAFYDPDLPDGRLYVWPVPMSGQWEIHILVAQALQQLALADTLNTPTEYLEALSFNLARRLRPMYGLPPDPAVESMATSSLSTIRAANADIPALRLPSGLSSNSGGAIYWPGLEIASP